MEISRLPFSQLPMLAKTDRMYAEENDILKKYYSYSVDIHAFADVIKDKSNDKTDRKTLVSVLKKQYKRLDTEGVDILKKNNFNENILKKIDSLSLENTFTVTTAHQPSLLTGPLYFIYKIFSTINLAEQLNIAYPKQNFLPVFVIGGEDHDFEEVNNVTIFGKKIIWQRDDAEKGAVGMMKTTSLQGVLAELKPILGDSDNAKAIFDIIETVYTKHLLYQDATQHLLHALFGEYGLIVLNMNDDALKRLFIPIMEKELTEQASKTIVEKTQAELSDLGFKTQAFARDINLFYLYDNLRERIVEENGIFKVLNTNITWDSAKDIINQLHKTPQYFSPNVVLRPLFQEFILPNLAYIGGGGELAYWLERKAQFQHFGVNFPMLIRRNSVLFVDKATQEKMTRLNVQLIDFTQDTNNLINKYVSQQATDPLSISIEKEALSQLFDAILTKAIAVDATLEKAVLAEKTKQLQNLESLESRILKAEKQKHETVLNQVKILQQKLFPNGGLQERVDNFLPLYLKHKEMFFDVLKTHLNPLEKGMIIIYE